MTMSNEEWEQNSERVQQIVHLLTRLPAARMLVEARARRRVLPTSLLDSAVAADVTIRVLEVLVDAEEQLATLNETAREAVTQHVVGEFERLLEEEAQDG